MGRQGEWLKRQRTEARMTQAQLAEAVGLTPQFIGMMERDERPIEKRTRRAIEHAVAPIQFYTDFKPSPELEVRIVALLDEVTALAKDGPVGGIVRTRGGRLMLGIQRDPRDKEQDPDRTDIADALRRAIER